GLQEWFDAALRLNPQLAEGRARVLAAGAAERTAAERPNPTMDLFGEYVETAAHSGAWLYGLSLDFLLRRPGDRARARHYAAARLAAAVGLPASALQGTAIRWDRWADTAALVPAAADDWRGEALIARPEIVRALREYDLAAISLQGELARRWPQAHLNPGYSWGRDGVRADPLNDVTRESAVGVTFELPVFNQHQGAIGEALARVDTAREHLMAIQADLYEQID